MRINYREPTSSRQMWVAKMPAVEILGQDPKAMLEVQADDIEWLYLPSRRKQDKDDEGEPR